MKIYYNTSKNKMAIHYDRYVTTVSEVVINVPCICKVFEPDDKDITPKAWIEVEGKLTLEDDKAVIN